MADDNGQAQDATATSDVRRIVLTVRGEALQMEHPPDMSPDFARACLLRAADFLQQSMIAGNVVVALARQQKQSDQIRKLGLPRLGGSHG